MRMHRFAVVACGVVLAAGLAAGLAGCSTSGSTSTNGLNFVSGNGYVQIPVADRKTAPVLSGSLVGGGMGSLASAAGKVVVINVWASWCGPCIGEAPALVSASKVLSNVAFFGVDTRDNEGNAQAFRVSSKAPYPSFFNQDGSMVLELSKFVNMSATPTTVILDKQHRVAAAVYGPVTATTIRDLVQPLERES